jgi:alpha-galactosidase
MGAILKTLDRDIVFNLCQYGMSDVWKWGAEVGGHCWRTTGDVGLIKDSTLPGFYNGGLSNAQHHEQAGPGAWNDPDYILIGVIGNAHSIHDAPQPTKLTANEQYSSMSMWALMASPLFFSGDMARLDDFTLNILCNAEVIEVNQDVLGKQARVVRQTSEEVVFAKPMEDGSIAVGLFNLAEGGRTISVKWAEIQSQGKARVRDLWRHKDLGEFDGGFSAKLGRHDVALIRIYPER